MKTLRTYGNLAEAGFAQSLLESAGIPAALADENAYTLGYGRVVGDIRLQVEEQDVERAGHVLREGPDAPVFHAGQAAPPDDIETTGAGSGPTPRFPAGVFIAIGVAFLVLLFAAAQFRKPANISSEPSDRMEYDSNGDGKIDTVYTYRDNHLATVTVDRNHDGKPDEWEEYDSKGVIASMTTDQNFDGSPDTRTIYKHGELVSTEEDRDFNGVPDIFLYYDRDQTLVRGEVRPNGAALPSRLQRYVHGILREEQVDADQDGHLDYRIEYDPFGTPSEHLPIEAAK